LNSYGLALTDGAPALRQPMPIDPSAMKTPPCIGKNFYANDQAQTAAEYLPLIVAYRNGAQYALRDVATGNGFGARHSHAGYTDSKPAVLVTIGVSLARNY